LRRLGTVNTRRCDAPADAVFGIDSASHTRRVIWVPISRSTWVDNALSDAFGRILTAFNRQQGEVAVDSPG